MPSQTRSLALKLTVRPPVPPTVKTPPLPPLILPTTVMLALPRQAPSAAPALQIPAPPLVY